MTTISFEQAFKLLEQCRTIAAESIIDPQLTLLDDADSDDGAFAEISWTDGDHNWTLTFCEARNKTVQIDQTVMFLIPECVADEEPEAFPIELLTVRPLEPLFMAVNIAAGARNCTDAAGQILPADFDRKKVMQAATAAGYNWASTLELPQPCLT